MLALECSGGVVVTFGAWYEQEGQWGKGPLINKRCNKASERMQWLNEQDEVGAERICQTLDQRSVDESVLLFNYSKRWIVIFEQVFDFLNGLQIFRIIIFIIKLFALILFWLNCIQVKEKNIKYIKSFTFPFFCFGQLCSARLRFFFTKLIFSLLAVNNSD